MAGLKKFETSKLTDSLESPYKLKTSMKTEDYKVDAGEINGVKIKITSYKMGASFYCHIANAQPGATIARADASTAQEAMKLALAKATLRLSPGAR